MTVLCYGALFNGEVRKELECISRNDYHKKNHQKPNVRGYHVG